ncbi:endonuclease domain-containing protein [Bifidobacterium choloepi]|uniref:DUF559 domain-containing protein n=1 Tax=Bifidobacterium choloepi TaxID=2614131 RepID=A0A6I5N0X7_9BIFI|nr:DUF559 domain-containing protein [Bifidobacterium choloepi]NEG70116.1 DUF559 domain-containing protein [Bifidobacterium choloepi]
MSAIMEEEAISRHLRMKAEFEAFARRAKFTPVFSHRSAMEFYGYPIPESCPATSSPPHLAFSTRNARHAMRGSVSHLWSASMDTIEVDQHDPQEIHYEVVTPVVAWAQMATCMTEEDLAVLGCSLTCRNRRLHACTVETLEEYVENNPHFHGRQRCRKALEWIVNGTDSPPEAVLYGVLKRNGLNDFVPNVEVKTPRGTYRIDLAWPRLKVGLEYQGSYHAETMQMRRDIQRDHDLKMAGWQIIYVCKDDLSTDQSRTTLLRLIRRIIEAQRATLVFLA